MCISKSSYDMLPEDGSLLWLRMRGQLLHVAWHSEEGSMWSDLMSYSPTLSIDYTNERGDLNILDWTCNTFLSKSSKEPLFLIT